MKNDQIGIQKDQKTPINLFDTIVSSDRYGGEVYTPFNIAEDMINLLPPDQDTTFWNPNTTFLDIYCKSGVFLEILYRRLMGVLANFPGYEDEQVRSSHILNNQLFGLSPLDDGGLMLATRRVCGDIFHKNLIHYDIQNVMKDISYRAGKNFELYEQNLVNTLKQVTNKEFNKMNFNVVIGNPPYNRGGDIDFVNLSYEIQTDFVVMITPAKWQTAEADQKIASKMSYGQFRKKLVPHMREVVFYPDCGDVFNIGVADGITYYLLEKNIQSKCIIVNKCKLQKYFNNTSNREIRADSVLNNLGTEIIEYLGKYDRFKFKKYSECRYQVWINTQINPGYGRWGHSKSGYGGELSDGGGNGGFFLSLSGNANIVGKIQIIDTENGEKISSGTAILGMQSDKLNECESFKSYINCKFTRFFVLINISKVTVANDNTFRFVPVPMVLDEQGNRVPGKFDHIYTDEELYKTWNLPQKYIDVIEAVIKERK